MYSLQRHAQGNLTQLCNFLGLDIPELNYTTLNQKFNVGTDLVIPNGSVAKGLYWGIGNGGFYVSGQSVDGTISLTPTPHDTSHTGLFHHIPFIMRPVSSDLDALTRAKYRMRATITHGGTTYWAYYLKKIDMTGIVATLEKRTSAQSSTPVAFTHVASDLSPTPPSLAGGGSLTATGEYVGAVTMLPFTFTTEEQVELVNCINILYDGDIGKAMIGEIALVSGVDVVNTVSGVSYTEAAKAKLSNSLATSIPMHVLTQGVSMNIKLEALSAVMAVSA